MRVDVNYIDSIGGGSGSTRMEINELPCWLTEHKGTLVRAVIPVTGSASEDHQVSNKLGWERLSQFASNRC